MLRTDRERDMMQLYGTQESLLFLWYITVAKKERLPKENVNIDRKVLSRSVAYI